MDSSFTQCDEDAAAALSNMNSLGGASRLNSDSECEEDMSYNTDSNVAGSFTRLDADTEDEVTSPSVAEQVKSTQRLMLIRSGLRLRGRRIAWSLE